MSLSDRAIAARARANWWALVGFVAFRQGLVWGIVAGLVIFALAAPLKISLRDVDYTVAHLRASSAVAANRPNTTMGITDAFGRRHQVTAFQVVTHPVIGSTAQRTKDHLSFYGTIAGLGAAAAFALGFYSVIRGARR